MTGPDWVLVARLVRPQGRKGEIIAELFTDFPGRFKERPRVFLAGPKAQTPPREALIEMHWLHQGRVVLKFKGVDSINDAETLRGMDVVVPAEDRVPLTDDAVYVGDLIGCNLLDVAGPEPVDVGKVVDVERSLSAAPDLLVVAASKQRGTKAGPLLIPFAKSYVVSIDIAAKLLSMRLPSGLTDLNVASSEKDGEGDA